MKQIFFKVFAGCLLVGWMIVIFQFSAQPAEESGAMSNTVAFQFLDSAERIFGIDLSELDRFHLVEKLTYPIRKSAHMTEYAILALLAMLFWHAWGAEEKRAYRLSFLLAAVYAGTDEFHQLFVPGREGMIVDVFIDMAGVLIGLFLLCVLRRMVAKNTRKMLRKAENSFTIKKDSNYKVSE